MPDNVPPLTTQNQIDWHAMLHELEKSVELMGDAIDGVRMAVRKLVMAEAWLPPITVEPPAAVPADAFEPVADQMAGIAVPPPIAEEMHRAAADIAPPPAPEEVEATQELVQRFVDEVREEPAPALAPAQPQTENDEAAREAVRRAVEQARTEFAAPQPAPVPEPTAAAPMAEDDDEAREAVRRAVEQARAELSGAPREMEPAPAPPPPRVLPQRPVNPMHLLPTLTIEDHESRVELARVYALLQLLGVASQASLLNYTSRQVSVMLGADAARLTADDYIAAVSRAMDRQSTVRIDGANVIVALGEAARVAKEEAA